MHRSPASQRRRAKVRRRDQIRRRRAVALAVLVTLIVLAVWAAYAIPGQTPARVPQSAATPTVDGSPDGAGGERSSSTAGLDVGAVPGSAVVSPADGKVTGIKRYRILGRYADVEMHIQLAHDPSCLLYTS